MPEGYITRLAPYFLLIFIQATLFWSILSLWNTTDEITWIGNGIKFEQALLQHKWRNTRLTTRPGVTVEWVVALTSRFVLGKDTLLNTLPDILTAQKNITSASRISIASSLILLNLLFFYFLKRLFSAPLAFFISLLLGLHPLFTETMFLVWTDMFLVYFMVVPIITFLLYIKTYFEKYIFLSGIFFGLAILTKIIAWVIVPILLAIIFIQNKQKHKLLNAAGITIFVGLVTFYLLYPASWLHPGIIFDRVQEINVSYSNPVAVQSNQPFWQYVLFAFLIDPLLIILSLLIIYMLARQWHEYTQHKLSLIFFSAALLYLVSVMLVSFLKDSGIFSIHSDRYIAPLIPFLMIGSFGFLHSLKKHWLITFLAIAFSIFYVLYF